jgi:ABC-type Fe3+-siderophore transport system permease subunit
VADLKQFKLSTGDKVAAVALSVLAAALVGACFAIAGAGLFWWNEIPLPKPTTWFIVSVAVVSFATFFFVLWQFISGRAFPSELWRGLGKYFRDGNDLSS